MGEYLSVLFLSTEQTDEMETWLHPTNSIVPCLKISHTQALLGGFIETLRSSADFPKPSLERTYPDTWLSLLESCVWRCGTCVHVCSKRVAQVGALFIIYTYIYFYALLKLLPLCLVTCTCLILFLFRLKINPITGCNDCAFYFCAWCGCEHLPIAFNRSPANYASVLDNLKLSVSVKQT